MTQLTSTNVRMPVSDNPVLLCSFLRRQHDRGKAALVEAPVIPAFILLLTWQKHIIATPSQRKCHSFVSYLRKTQN